MWEDGKLGRNTEKVLTFFLMELFTKGFGKMENLGKSVGMTKMEKEVTIILEIDKETPNDNG